MTAVNALCPAATGILVRHETHPGLPHRCHKPAAHITEPPTDPDHLCVCGAEWASGPTIAEQARQLNRIIRQHEAEMDKLRAAMADIVRAAAAHRDPVARYQAEVDALRAADALRASAAAPDPT